MVKKGTDTKIDANTQIIFSIRSFIVLITSMLGLFYGFYQLVVVPKVDKMEEHYQLMYNDQKEQNRLFYDELGKINTSIGSLNTSINVLNESKKNVPVNNSNVGKGSFGFINTKYYYPYSESDSIKLIAELL
jgi:hypothetical protein